MTEEMNDHEYNDAVDDIELPEAEVEDFDFADNAYIEDPADDVDDE